MRFDLDEPLWPLDHALPGLLSIDAMAALEEEWKVAKVDEWCAVSALTHAAAAVRRATGRPAAAPIGFVLTDAARKALTDNRVRRALTAYEQAATTYEGVRARLADLRNRVTNPDICPSKEPQVTLPEPGDVQVATGVPEVETYREAWLRARDARREMERDRRHLDRIRNLAVKGTPRQLQIKARARQEYRASADAAFEADGQLHEAEKAAEKAAPAVLERLRVSRAVYWQRLRDDYAVHGHRLYRR